MLQLHFLVNKDRTVGEDSDSGVPTPNTRGGRGGTEYGQGTMGGGEAGKAKGKKSATEEISEDMDDDPAPKKIKIEPIATEDKLSQNREVEYTDKSTQVGRGHTPEIFDSLLKILYRDIERSNSTLVSVVKRYYCDIDIPPTKRI